MKNQKQNDQYDNKSPNSNATESCSNKFPYLSATMDLSMAIRILDCFWFLVISSWFTISHEIAPFFIVFLQFLSNFCNVKTIKTNTAGTINMLGLAKRVKAKILIASTSEVYGDPEVHPQPETYWGHVNPIGPRACYDEGKRVAETLAYAYEKQESVQVRVARIFNTYGPRMHMNDGRVVSNFILQALKGMYQTSIKITSF